MAHVLVVAARDSTREALGAALERGGFDVFTCPGPQAPSFVCVGGAGGRCALARATDVVVLDTDLMPDRMHRGTRSWDLLSYYRGLGLPVVVLADGEDLQGPMPDGDVRYLTRATDATSVTHAVEALLRHEASA